MSKVYLVGFNFALMDEKVKTSGGYYDKAQFVDRIMAIDEVGNEVEAVKVFMDKLKNWITPHEKQFVVVMDSIDQNVWVNEYYRSEYSWLRKLGVR